MSFGSDDDAAMDGASPPPPRDHGADTPAMAPPPVAPTPVPPVFSAVPPLSSRTAWGPLLTQWLQAQRPKRYWRVLAGGVVGLFFIWFLIVRFKLGFIVPLYDLAFGLLLPTAVVLYWWEHGAPDVLPRDALRIALAGGAVVGLLTGLVLYGLLNLGSWALWDTVVVAVIAELLKLAAVAYLLLDARLRREMDGLILAFVAMLGFSALETASYAYITFQQTNTGGYSVPGFSLDMFRPAIANMDHVLSFQLLLQVMGDWVWTAILCAAIWRERGAATVALTRGVGLAFGIVIVLHALWNYGFAHQWLQITIGGGFLQIDTLLYLPIFTLLVAVVGLVVLSFFIEEARQRAALGPDAPPPPPLDQALLAYIAGLRQRLLSSA